MLFGFGFNKIGQKSEYECKIFHPRILSTVLAILLIGSTPVLSLSITTDDHEDVVIFLSPQSSADKRDKYVHKLLNAALDITIKKYGPYRLKFLYHPVSRKRLIRDAIAGDSLNIFASAPSLETEKNLLTVRIPINRGLGNYRVLLIHKSDAALFQDIDIKGLKALSAGLHSQWSTTKVMEEQGFSITKAIDYEALFTMLERRRYQYFLRRVTEVFTEIEMRQEQLPNVKIEPTLLINLPLPTYFYVSPKQPRLAARIEKGLNMMIANGDMEKLFYTEYADIIKRIQFSKRRILKIDNHHLSDHTPYERAELWYTPDTR